MLLAKRLIGVLLLLAGLVVSVAGGWLTSRVGTDGTARFVLAPTTAAPILLEPSLLNPLTTDAVVTVTPATGQEFWIGTGGVADTRAAIDRAQVVHAEGVDLRSGLIRTTVRGEGAAGDVQAADVWRRAETSTQPITWTVRQGQSPDALLIVSDKPIAEVTVSWTHRSWFFQALVLTLVGVIGAGVGIWLIRAKDRDPLEESA